MRNKIIQALLESPCIFCDYNGEGYWQAGKHEKGCPWQEVGGADVRALWVVRKLKALIGGKR